MKDGLVLASASPRRLELLRSIGVEPRVEPANLNESVLPGEDPISYVERIACNKAMVVGERNPDAIVLGADTAVALDGEIFGKPVDDDHARQMLLRLSGRTHHVHTGIAIGIAGVTGGLVVSTEVAFRSLAETEIDWYLSLGQHSDKAGAYGIQGTAGSFVSTLHGSMSAVIGLPLAETISLLRGTGFAVAPAAVAASA